MRLAQTRERRFHMRRPILGLLLAFGLFSAVGASSAEAGIFDSKATVTAAEKARIDAAIAKIKNHHTQWGSRSNIAGRAPDWHLPISLDRVGMRLAAGKPVRLKWDYVRTTTEMVEVDAHRRQGPLSLYSVARTVPQLVAQYKNQSFDIANVAQLENFAGRLHDKN
jgi:hypothetical protein